LAQRKLGQKVVTDCNQSTYKNTNCS